MLKILRRLTAIVLSFMMLLTGGRGYAMNSNNGRVQQPASGSADNGANPQAQGDANEGDVLRRNANIARGALERINRIAGNTLQTINSANNPQLQGGANFILSCRNVGGINIASNEGLNNVNTGLLKNLKVIDYNASESDHIDLFFGANMLSDVFVQNALKGENACIDIKKEIIAIPMQDFFLYPPKSIQELINRCKLKKELINFYSLSKMSQVDIENDQPPFSYNEKVCRTICCGLKNRWVVPAVILISAIGFTVSMIGLAQDGWTKNEIIAAVFLGVLLLFSAGAGGVAARECAKGCCKCCVSDELGGEEFLKRHSHPPEKILGPDYFRTLIREEIMFQNNDNEFCDINNWNLRNTILFFPLKNGKYIMGIVKNADYLGDRNLPTTNPHGSSSFQNIFESNKQYFFYALDGQ